MNDCNNNVMIVDGAGEKQQRLQLLLQKNYTQTSKPNITAYKVCKTD